MNFFRRRPSTPIVKTPIHYLSPRGIQTACRLLREADHIPKNRLTANVFKATCPACKATIHERTKP
jgi:hypothetical protein